VEVVEVDMWKIKRIDSAIPFGSLSGWDREVLEKPVRGIGSRSLP